MIKIDKDVEVPTVLIEQGKLLRRKMEAEYDKKPDAYQGSNPDTFQYKPSVYGAESVKEKLRQCQYNKCCYSEAKFVAENPHVEHFRPKGRVNKGETRELLYPGYYWLAYEWDNLYLSKEAINESHKRNFFPLADEAQRARNHHRDIVDERPLLIDPGKEDPREHIRFHSDEPRPYQGSKRGEVTIRILNLRRPELAHARQRKISLLKSIVQALESLLDYGINDGNVTNLRNILLEAVLPESEFSSMAIDYLSQQNICNQLLQTSYHS